MIKKFFPPLLIIILVLAGYLLGLAKIPPGLVNDETDIAYEAYSLSQTARDQWGNFMPLTYFRGFGGTRLPLLVYWSVPFIKVFGLNPPAVRLAGAAAALLALIGFWLLTKKIYGSGFALAATILLWLTPWFWGLSRTTNEAVLGLAMTTLAIWAITRKSYILAAIFFGLSAYTYYSNQIFIPLFLSLFFIKERQNLKNQRIIVSGLLLALLVLPLVFKSVTGAGSGTRLGQTGLFSNVAIIGELNVRLSNCAQNAPLLWCKIVYNRPLVWLEEIFRNYLNHFSFSFLFQDNNFVGILPPGKIFYWMMIPGFLAGTYFLIKKDLRNRWLWFSWLVTAPIADSLTSGGHAMRSLLIVPPIIIISIFGWKNLCRTKFLILSVVGLFLIEITFFASDYWWYFPKEQSAYSHYQYRELFKQLLPIANNYPQIYLSNASQSVQQYSFYLFYSKYDPATFQGGKDVEWTQDQDGWLWVKKIGKWNFVKSLPSLETVPENSLFIGNESELSQISKPRKKYILGNQIFQLSPISKVTYLNKDTAFIITKLQKIPLTEIDNRLIE